eukprot:g28737.t1
MGEILNKDFDLVFTVDEDMEDIERGEINSNILKNFHIRKEEVLDVLKCIKVDKSLGPDQVYPRTLREARNVISGPFAEVFVSLVATGEASEDWRLDNTVPLFKKVGEEKLGNYRPVSLTSVVGNLLEGILRDRIYMYLERHGLIRDSQHGYVRGKSCLTNLIELFEEVTKKFDEGRAVDLNYMDFSKVFDMVDWLARKDVVKLEVVQKSLTSMLPGLDGLSYRDRLNRLELFSVERQRLRGDLIEVFNNMTDMGR